MASPARFPTGIFVESSAVLPSDTTIPVGALSAVVRRQDLVQDTVQPYVITPDQMRTWDNFNALLPGTAAADDLAVIEGTFGTDAVTIQGSDFGGTSITQYCRFQFTLPPEYDDGETITIRIRGGMLTTVSDGTATVDVECHVNDDDGAVGSDICTTSATTINSLTFGNDDFTITPTGRAPGDVLDVRITVAGSDTGDAGVMIPEISKVSVLLDVKG